MSSLTIHESISLDAEPDVVWRFLIDPERVVTCLPGAELVGETEEGAYEGTVSVNVGAVKMAYGGTAVFEEVDAEARYVRIVGRGREKAGSGNVSMTMESRVEAPPDGGTLVTVDARIRLAGKIVRFGRGMVQTVSDELFGDFTECMAGIVVAESRGSAEPTAASLPDSSSVSLPSLLWRAFKRWLRGLFGSGTG